MSVELIGLVVVWLLLALWAWCLVAIGARAERRMKGKPMKKRRKQYKEITDQEATAGE